MLAALSWYVVLSIAGWLSFPLAYRFLPALADRGYAFTRSLGVLLWGYIFWLLASLGGVHNNAGGILLAASLLLVISLWVGKNAPYSEMIAWLRRHWRVLAGVEMVFLLAFAGMAIVRAANPEILGTEKPMELAFINAILRSPTFPPHDPWLSGYAISYYYFGYVIVAMLAKLTHIPGGVAFNLGIAMVFALSAVGAYGILYDLLCTPGWQGKAKQIFDGRQRLYALLGPVFVLLVSNAEGFLEILHARGLFWKIDANGQLSSSFWKWLDIVDLNQPPAQPFTWLPARFWWWWRASRVVQDYNYAGNPLEIIDEFPVFSYLLADLHPHVLAMPFAFLAMALALNLLLGGFKGSTTWRRRVNFHTQVLAALGMFAIGVFLLWLGLSSLDLRLGAMGIVGIVAAGMIYLRIPPSLRRFPLQLLGRNDPGWGEFGLTLDLTPPALVLSALVLGGLAFLNTWDFPIYLALFAGAYALSQLVQGVYSYRPLLPGLLKDFFVLIIVLGVLGVGFYLPFYLGFSSQAGGFLPNLIYPTRGAQLWVMFATLLLPLSAYLLYLWRVGARRSHLFSGFALGISFVVILWVSSWVLALVILALPGVNELYLSSLAAPSGADLFRTSLLRRLASPGGWVTALALLGFTLGLLGSAREPEVGNVAHSKRLAIGHLYALLLTLFGVLLVIGAEFFFLRDQFGWRINTIFKFYYQAWLLWGIAAAFGSAVLLQTLPRIWGVLFRLGLLLVLMVGFTYTVLGLWSKTNGFQPAQGWSLDGTKYLEASMPDDMAAIRWLASAPQGVVAEAVGGSYSEYARVATLSGQPNVLGWPGHESQWRGGAREMGSRQADLERLYCTHDWQEAQSIIRKYGIRFIYVGELERITYLPNPDTCPTGLYEEKFSRYLSRVYQQGGVTIYEAPGE